MGHGPSLFGEQLASCKKELSRCFLCSHRAAWKDWACSCCDKWCCVQITLKSAAEAPFAVTLYLWFVGCCCFGLNEDQLSISVGPIFSSLLSSLIPSLLSLFIFLCLLCLSSCFLFCFFFFLFISLSFSFSPSLSLLPTWTQQNFHTLYAY